MVTDKQPEEMKEIAGGALHTAGFGDHDNCRAKLVVSSESDFSLLEKEESEFWVFFRFGFEERKRYEITIFFDINVFALGAEIEVFGFLVYDGGLDDHIHLLKYLVFFGLSALLSSESF